MTTDTAAAQRALEIEAEIVFKATRVDGVYTEDPEKNPHASLYRELKYSDVIEQNLRVMDQTAISQCMDCLLYTSPSPRDATLSRMPSSA